MYRRFLEQCDQIPGWQNFVEQHWQKVIRRTADYVLTPEGRVRPDFLTVSDERGYGVVGSWGTIKMPNVRQIEMHDELILDLDWWEVKDPQFGGLSKGQWNLAADSAHYLNHDESLHPLLDLKCSPTTIVDAYNLFMAFRKAKIDISNVEAVVQWGGGFGNQSRIMRTWGLKTEYLIDLPLASVLQYEYLRHAFGEEAVNLIRNERDSVMEGRINLVPLPFRDVVPDAPMFIALHSLNESTPIAQDYVVYDRNWFGAESCLLAWTDDLKTFNGNVFGPGVQYFADIVNSLPDVKRVGEYYYVTL